MGVLNKLGRLSTHQILDCADELGAAVNLLQFVVLRLLACTNDTSADDITADATPSHDKLSQHTLSHDTPCQHTLSQDTPLPTGTMNVLRSFLGLKSASTTSTSTSTSTTMAAQIHARIEDVFVTLREMIGMSIPLHLLSDCIPISQL